MVGKVTLPSGLVATFHEDWTWTVTVPEGIPPEVATLTKQFLELVYRPSPYTQGGRLSWLLYHFAMDRGGVVELASEDPDLAPRTTSEIG